ncbi:MAG: Gfo/Idh/MocA family oxidoreductase [Pyrinomonadaceae bacterium]
MGTVSKTMEAAPTRATVSANGQLRVGIVGVGLMGRWHTHASQKAGGEIIAVADINRAHADSFAAMFPTTQSFSDVDEMLAQTSLDVLHVCSPTFSHQKIAESAIKAGVHLLIEKPLAATAAETIALFDLAEDCQVNLCPVHQFAFQIGVEKAKKNLARIGRLVHLEANICSAGGAAAASPDKVDLIAADILPHPLSLLQTFLGTNLVDEGWEVFHPSVGELRITNRVGEISLSIFISMNSRPTTNYFRILGTNGTIHLDLFHGYSIIEPGKTSQTRKIWHPFDLALRQFSAATVNLAHRALRRESAYPGLRQLTERFYQTIKTGTKSPVTRAEAIAVAKIRDRLIKQAGITPAETS